MLNTRDKFSKYNKMKNEAENIDNQQGNGVLPCVSGSLHLPKMKKVKCNCPCHTDINIKHCMPCCDNGYKLVPEGFCDDFKQ